MNKQTDTFFRGSFIAVCHNEKSPSHTQRALSYLMPGSSLLSHGETPHYHRRYGVSLLSSAWGQVGPPRYSRQANSFIYRTRVLTGADTQSRTGDLTLTKGALYQLSHISTLNLMPGSSLLSHGETPHYHRRYGVSLLSSAWGQVGPPR